MRRPLSVVFAAALLGACGPQKEREANGDPASATLVRPGRVKGTLSGADDVDFYRVDVDQDAVLTARVGGIRDADFTLSVRERERGEIKRVDETATGGDEEALDVGVRAGSYLVVLSNKNPKFANPQQNYALELSLEKSVSREAEPNETAQSASRLELPGVTRGHFWPTQNLLAGDTDYLEQDWYRVEVSTGLFLLNIDVSEVGKVDSILEVYDVNGYRLKEADAGGVGEGESLKGFGVRGPVSFFVKLRAKTRSGNAGAPYEILTELIPYQGRQEFEPNDQRADATPFENPEISGAIAPAGDQDWYKISIADEGRVVLRAIASGVEGLDLQLRVADALGTTLLTVDNMGKGQPEVMTGLGATKGDYFIVLSEKSGRKADPRSQYTLARSLAPFQTGLELEVNDSTATAQPIKIDEGVDGYLGWRGDVDVYQFNAYQKGAVRFEVAGVLSVQLAARVVDQDGRALAELAGEKAGEPLAFERELEAGTYWLELFAKDPAQANVRDKYSLRLRAR